MEWGQLLQVRVRGWRVAGGLAVGSLVPAVPWQAVADITGWLAAYLDVFTLLVITLQPVVGSPDVGLALAWLLVAWLTYQHAHLLYPSEFEHVVDYPGFRLLTALGTLYFGVVAWGSIVDKTAPFQVLPATDTAGILALVGGIFGGGILFGVYLQRWHPEPLYDEQSDLKTLIQTSSVSANYEVDDLPDRWRRLDATAYPMLPALICVLVGMAGGTIHLFYPLPEAVFVVGLVALRVWPEADPTTGDVPRYEVDLRLLDTISGATRNLKGIIMIFFCVMWMLLSAMTFSALAVGSVAIATELSAPWAVDRVGRWALVVVGVVAFVLAILFMGVYSLLHWVRQLERIEPYARFWEDAGEAEMPDLEETALPTRPPGLLVPAHLPFVGFVLTAAVGHWTESDWIVWAYLAGVGIVAVVVMGWGLVWTRRHRDNPQPLTHESRNLLITFLIQLGTSFGFILVDPETLHLNAENGLPYVLLLLVTTGIYYVPEVDNWESRQEGFQKHLSAGYVPFVTLLLIALIRLVGDGPTLLIEGVLLGLAGLVVAIDLLNIYLERLVE